MAKHRPSAQREAPDSDEGSRFAAAGLAVASVVSIAGIGIGLNYLMRMDARFQEPF